MKTRFAAGIVALFGFVGICSGTPFLELQSTYLGDGWFRYRLNTFNDPFFRSANVGTFGITSFTNRIEYGPDPQDWTNDPAAGNFAAWNCQPTNQVRPYEREFFVRSSEHTYRVDTNFNALVVFSLRMVSDWFDYWSGQGVISGNIVGYAYVFPCLVPCSPDMADNSPPDKVAVLQIVDHDMTLNSLVVTNGQVEGVTFSAGFKSTVLLEGSLDYSHWTNIAYIWGNPGSTTWTTNVPLNDFGQFFRLELVAMDEHVTNLPPLSVSRPASGFVFPKAAASAGDGQIVAPSLTCLPQGEEMVVQFLSEQGQGYVIEAIDRSGKVVASRAALGTGTAVKAHFKIADLPNPVFFSAKSSR